MSLRLYQVNVWAATAINWHEPCCSFAPDCSLPPSVLGGEKKRPQLKLKSSSTPQNMLLVIYIYIYFFFSLSPSCNYIPWVLTRFQTLFSPSYWKVLLSPTWNGSIPPLHSFFCLRSFCSFTSHHADQHLPFWRAVIELSIIQENYSANSFAGWSLCMSAVS